MRLFRDRSPRRLISNVLFAIAALLFAYVVYAYVQDRRDNSDVPPTPPNIAGQANLKNVHDVIASQDAKVEYGQQVAHIDGLTAVGQQLIADGTPVFVFLFSDPNERVAETANVDLTTLALVISPGDKDTGGPYAVTEASNVMAVSVGADESLQSKIDAGIKTLP